MNLTSIQTQLQSQGIFRESTTILDRPTVTAYEKKFRWAWMATQLNTFVLATDYGDEPVTVPMIEDHLKLSFDYAREHYSGWWRGFQSGLGVISILLSTQLTPEAIDYCERLKSGKKWAGFTVPVVANPNSDSAHFFRKKPMWGRIYYPYFKRMIQGLM